MNLVRGTVGADVGFSDIDARGVLPHVERVPGGAPSCLDAAVEHVHRQLDRGIEPGDVVLLAADLDVSDLLEIARRRLGDDSAVLAAPSTLDAARTRVMVSDPSVFRGMERAWVAVACTQAFASQSRSDRFLYVAMTRARAGLAILLAGN